MTLRQDTRRVFLLIVALGMFAMAARPVTDPDVWWHLKTGQLILQNRAVFHSDPFSFTKAGQTWVNHEWLADVFIFAIYRLAGWLGLIAVFALATFATFILVFLRCGNNTYVSAAFAVWGAIASAPSWGVRPQIFSLLLASAFLLILERSMERPKLLWWTVPLMLVWVNLHAGFALGIAFVFLFMMGELVDTAFGFEQWITASARAKYLGVALAACLAIVPLNPYGWRMYSYPFLTVHSHSMQMYISEWMSPNFHQPMYVPAVLLFLAMFVTAALSPRRPRPSELVLLSVTAWAGLHSARHVPIFALVAPPILSKLTAACISRYPQYFRKESFEIQPATVRKIFNGAVLAAFLILATQKVRSVLKSQPQVEGVSYPVSAVSFLAANHFPGAMFNSYNWGGYLIWRLSPGYPVFLDGRADLYGDTFLDQFAATYQVSDVSWNSLLDHYQIKTVIVPPEAPLASALLERSHWKRVYADRQAVILRYVEQ